MVNEAQSCSHCESRLRKWRVPDGATWGEEFFLVCFNDECSYYQRGWVWMREQFQQNASHRYALNPRTGTCLPLPVWSDTATREMIMDEVEGGDHE